MKKKKKLYQKNMYNQNADVIKLYFRRSRQHELFPHFYDFPHFPSRQNESNETVFSSKWRWLCFALPTFLSLKFTWKTTLLTNGHNRIRVHQMLKNNPVSKGNKKWEKQKKKTQFVPFNVDTMFGLIFFSAHTLIFQPFIFVIKSHEMSAMQLSHKNASTINLTL